LHLGLYHHRQIAFRCGSLLEFAAPFMSICSYRTPLGRGGYIAPLLYSLESVTHVPHQQTRHIKGENLSEIPRPPPESQPEVLTPEAHPPQCPPHAQKRPATSADPVDWIHGAFLYLAPLIDLQDFGTWSPRRKSPTHRLPNAMLERLLNNEPVPDCLRQSLTVASLREHLAGTHRNYFKGTRSGGVVLVGLDIDLHSGEGKPEALARWVEREWLPGVYGEASTRGYHQYLKVDISCHNSEALTNITRRLNRVMNRAAIAAGLDVGSATIDGLKGSPSLIAWEGQRWRVVNRGSLIKLPMLPAHQASIQSLKDSPTFPLPHLENLANELGARYNPKPTTAKPTPSVKLGKGITPPPPLPPRVYLVFPNRDDWLADLPPDTLHFYMDHRHHPNPTKRMHGAYSLAVSHHNPEALESPESLCDYYEWLGFASSGNRTLDRIQRAKDVIAFRATGGGSFDLSLWQLIIDQFITPTVRADPRVWGRGVPLSPTNLPSDSLGAILCLITAHSLAPHSNPHLRFSTSYAQLRGYLKTLHGAKAISMPLGRRPYVSTALRLLQLSGLITLRRHHTPPQGGRPGVGYRWGLGVNHPHRPAFEALCTRLGVDSDLEDPLALPLLPN
jgi:hypothetical protein